MKIEVLYIEGCPNHRLALERLVDALRERSLPETFTQVAVTGAEQAKKLGFPGSPTIRINGQDVDPGVEELPESSYACRTYTDQGRQSGVPSRDLIRRAIHRALEKNHGRE